MESERYETRTSMYLVSTARFAFSIKNLKVVTDQSLNKSTQCFIIRISAKFHKNKYNQPFLISISIKMLV